MRIGLALHITDRTIGPADLATAAEKRGFYSLYFPEHTHIPVSRRTPAPTGGGELADEYRRGLDPCVALAAAAAVTRSLRLGTGIALVAQHDPISYAKQLATLDWLSSGRLVLGIGYGWNREEMENHGIDVRSRRARVREQILAMRELWTKEIAEFHGDFVDFEPSWQWPKPVQQPGPRVLIGGAPGPILFAHVAEFADGWMPVGGAGLAQAIPELRRAFESRGRDSRSLQIVPIGVLPSREKLVYYESLGVTEVALRLPAESRDSVLEALDAYTEYLQESEPHSVGDRLSPGVARLGPDRNRS